MKVELDVYSALCETKVFVVNGIKATYKDFGLKYDASPDKAKKNYCGYMLFEPIKPTQQVLEKYCLTKKEYNHICKLLQASISFGTCRMCG